MDAAFQSAFEALKTVFSPYLGHVLIKADTATDYELYSRVPSPFPQHKGHPMYFGAVRLGRAYVAFHLMPLYMNEALATTISPALKKRMQGKTCFNFKTMPEPELMQELQHLTAASYDCFRTQS